MLFLSSVEVIFEVNLNCKKRSRKCLPICCSFKMTGSVISKYCIPNDLVCTGTGGQMTARKADVGKNLEIIACSASDIVHLI